MSFSDLAMLLTSILFSAGRNIFSKHISSTPFGQKNFFFFQATIFLTGSVVLGALAGSSLFSMAGITLIYALLYGLLLIMAQWCYIAALKTGNTAVCATVYSLGFIIPTLSGMFFWGESMNAMKFAGILTVIPTIILSGAGNKQAGRGKAGYIFPLCLAMLASGGLGIMQKVQQSSPYPEQMTAFVLAAFLLAGAVSLIAGFAFGAKCEKAAPKKFVCAAGVGLCFSACNVLNTLLAGRLESAVFFPLLNIGMILLSLLMSVVLLHEKFARKQWLILALGIASILLISLAP